MRRFLCGVKLECCQGAATSVNSGLGKFAKTHSSHEEAFNCYAHYLMKHVGLKRLGRRKFENPDGSIMWLTKPAQFGAELRMGKNVEGKGKRVTPKQGKRPGVGGIVISN